MKFDPRILTDYIASHGFGDPTPEGLTKAARLFDGDYAATAADIVTLGLTTEPEPDSDEGLPMLLRRQAE